MKGKKKMPSLIKIQTVHCPKDDVDVTDDICCKCRFYGGQDAQLLYCDHNEDNEPCNTCKSSHKELSQNPCSACTKPNWKYYKKGEDKY